MRITQLLTANTIQLDLQATTKEAVLEELADVLVAAGHVENRDGYVADLLAREAQSSTGIGEGIAIPHAKSASVMTPAIAFGRQVHGIDYNSLDGQPATLFFMIAASEGANNEHLETLSKLATFLMDPQFTKQMLEATTPEEVIRAIEEKEGVPAATNEATPLTAPRILAVTACPTGIAHTFMAAEKLQETAKQKNIAIKVETNGSGGVKNRLTAQDIAEADTIIVAADTKVDMARFHGKHVIQTKVGKAIYEADALIDRAIAKDAPLYEHAGDVSPSDEQQGFQFYKHLMNGVSNMLPFVVGGGILIALSFFWGINSSNPDSPEYNEFAAMLNTIGGGNAFFLMVPVLAGFIAMSIADRPGFAPGMVGGLLAITVTNDVGAHSGFLGGLLAGFLAGYIVLGLKKLLAKLPQQLEGLKPVLFYPVLGIGIVGLLMMLINPQLTKVYTALTSFLEGLSGTNTLILGLILGGMMAVDMGGPINKAAYTFGIAMLEAGNYNMMAAVMAGGMVPPLAVGFATTFFKNRFTKQEREAGKTAYVLGACFISEGAIPFAAADPIRVIPSFVFGAAITGALTMLFDIALRAPHGGIFVIGLVDGGVMQAALYIVAILAGALISAVSIGFLKKQV
ncbi:PTS fructose transporter subunit IIABC [Caryophanon tenue]|uniref:PTS fructose transporter subunit IIA n=1 Tax=Caryophanon tenue TaxID=33978 RepID=A0A1C0YD52_9BACL|nr:fructose-specific PTS transporter subunit EIIC [Caryophanon tenue]OCS85069.1 PTS fructose transporter subunit IIA [Caryophanon tenue]